MPEMIPPEAGTLSVERGVPVVCIAGARARDVEGWGLLHRRTLMVIEGPGDEGFLIPRATPTDTSAPLDDEWDTAVSTALAVLVRFTDTGQEIGVDVLRD